jgi:hypothetical protein
VARIASISPGASQVPKMLSETEHTP